MGMKQVHAVVEALNSLRANACEVIGWKSESSSDTQWCATLAIATGCEHGWEALGIISQAVGIMDSAGEHGGLAFMEIAENGDAMFVLYVDHKFTKVFTYQLLHPEQDIVLTAA